MSYLVNEGAEGRRGGGVGGELSISGSAAPIPSSPLTFLLDLATCIEATFQSAHIHQQIKRSETDTFKER